MEQSDNQNNKKEKPSLSNLDRAKIKAKVNEFDAMLKGLMKVKPPQKES